MSIQKKPTVHILSACLIFSIIFMLWRTFGAAEVPSHHHHHHTRLYHPTSLLLANAHLQTRHIKPQTLPKRKVANPFPPYLRKALPRTNAPALNELPMLLPSPNTQDASKQTESSSLPPPPSSEDLQADEPQLSTEGGDQGVASLPTPEGPVMAVPCSHDMSQPCLPDQ